MTASLTTFLIIAAIVFGFGYILDRWITPWRISRMTDRILRDIQEGKPSPPRDYHFEIIFDALGFEVHSLKKAKPESIRISWNTVNRIVAFKRDLLTVDRICLLITTDDGRGVELDEELKGWDTFIQDLPQHLPGCKALADWLMPVATPAFATNETELFSRTQNREATPLS